MGWHTWGGAGPHATAFLNKLEDTFAGDLQGWPKLHAINSFRRQLSYALMSYVDKQLKAAEEAIILQNPPTKPTTFIPGPLFTPLELKAWDTDADEPLFLGPIRIARAPVGTPHPTIMNRPQQNNSQPQAPQLNPPNQMGDTLFSGDPMLIENATNPS